MATQAACRIFLPLLSPFIDGELSTSDRVSVERHLSACPTCTSRVSDLRAESGLIRVGMEMAADEVDFTDFAQQVMARVTPERLPFWERVKLRMSESWAHQPWRMAAVTGLAVAAVAALVAVPFLRPKSSPQGDALQRVQLLSVNVNPDAHVTPVVIYAESGDIILMLADHPDHDEAIKRQQQGKAPGSDAEDEEEGVKGKGPGGRTKGQVLEPQRPSGGEL